MEISEFVWTEERINTSLGTELTPRSSSLFPLEEGMKLPETDSIRELAEFWETHELTAFDDQLEEVPQPIFVRPRSVVTVSLSGDERTAVQKIAAARGVDEAALIHEWVQEKLHH